MGEIMLDRKARLLNVAAAQRHLGARDKHNILRDESESKDWLLSLGERLEILLLYRDAAKAYQIAENAWADAGSGCDNQLDKVRNARRGCEESMDGLGKTITGEVWEFSESNRLDPVYRHLVICEAERRANELPVSSLVDAYRADALLSKAETWGGVEFPWVKITWVKVKGED